MTGPFMTNCNFPELKKQLKLTKVICNFIPNSNRIKNVFVSRYCLLYIYKKYSKVAWWSTRRGVTLPLCRAKCPFYLLIYLCWHYVGFMSVCISIFNQEKLNKIFFLNNSLVATSSKPKDHQGLTNPLLMSSLHSYPSLSSTSLMLALVIMASSHLNHWSLCWRMKLV